MSEVRQLSAEERIEDALADRLHDLKLLVRGISDEDEVTITDRGETLGTVEMRAGDYEVSGDRSDYLNEDGEVVAAEVFAALRDDLNERLNDAWYEYGLGFDYVTAGTFWDQDEGFFRYQLSTGGPGDEFRFFADAAGHVHRVEYWYLDWFDGASRRLYDDDRALLEEVFERFKDAGSVDAELARARDDEEFLGSDEEASE